MTDKRDYYEVLGVGKNATAEEIKRSYRSLARKYHPDVNREDGAESTFKEINEAYEILSDDQKRAAYDRYGHQAFNGGGFQPGGFGDIFDIFGDIFGGMAGRARPSGPVAEPGDDLRIDLEITLEEAAHGTTKTLK